MSPAPGETRAWKNLRRGGEPADGSVFQRHSVHGLLELRLSLLPRGGSPIPVPLVAACASEAIRKDTGMISWLQWPDLVSIGGKAVGRASVSKGPSGLTTAEMTVNCYAPLKAESDEISRTSIFEALGVEIDLGLLRDKVVHAFDWYLAEWERGMHQKMVDRILPTISWMGSEVEVFSKDGRARGKAEGIADDCALVLVQGGRRRAFAPDSVRLVKPVS